MLWLLALLPVAIAIYVALARRKRRTAIRYAGLATASEAAGAALRVRRYVPPVLFLVALALMLVAIARPAAVIMVPSRHETVVLAMDVSGSMRASDVRPNRVTAAQEAARTFIAGTPRSTRIGVVSFAATASV